MKTTKFLFGTLLVMTILASCSKSDTDTDTNDTDCDGTCELVEYNTMDEFFEVNGVQSETFSIDAEDGGTITGEQGTIITIPTNAFVDADGNPVIGEVDVLIKEIFAPSEMILSNRPTNAIDDSGDNTFLLSEGETEILIEQNGEELAIAPGTTLSIGVPTDNDFDSTMRPFTGTVDEDNNITWAQNRQVEMMFQTAPNTYIYDTFEAGWTNCDKFFSYPGDKTTNYIDLSSSPNQDEATVYVVFKENGLPAVVGFTQSYADGLQSYVNSLPVGLEVTYVGLTINDNQQYLAVETVTIAEDETLVLPFTAVSTDEILEALELLN